MNAYLAVLLISTILAVIVSLFAFEVSYHNNHTLFFDVHKTPKPSAADNAKIHIDARTITLTKTHLAEIKTELYQPSFRLEGVVDAHRYITLHLPDDGKLSTIEVKIGQRVSPGDVIATFVQPTPIIDLIDNNYLDNQSNDSNKTTNIKEQTDKTLESLTETSTRNIAIIAPTFGFIAKIFTRYPHNNYKKSTPVALIGDDSQFKLVSVLPKSYKRFINDEKLVNFTTKDGRKFIGQINKIDKSVQNLANFGFSGIQIHILIPKDEAEKAKLHIGDKVSGSVEYGQLTTGVLVPAFAVFDNAQSPFGLNTLKKPPYKPITPLHAYVWEVGQDGYITLAPVDVIEYRPKSDQYLVSGVTLTGLIVLADLPKNAQNKLVKLEGF